jgi:two-component system, NarL family, sensor histidine kinase LiaS
MKSGIFSLRRLRWKLTLSYTLVTVVALLALELLLLSAVVAFLSSELWPAFIAQQIRDSFAPQLEEPLTRNPPDKEALKEALTPFSSGPDGSGTGPDVPERDVGTRS